MKRPIIFAIAWLIASLAVTPLCLAQNNSFAPITMDVAELLSYDRDIPLSPTEELADITSGHKAYKVSYYSINDHRVTAMLILPPTIKEGDRLPAILLMHGLGMDKSGLKLLWDQLAKNGYAVLAIDAQYHGDRKPKEKIEVFGRHVYSSRDMLVQTVVDLRRGIDYLQSRKDIDPDHIGYVGFSMGGILGSIVSGVDTRIQAPVLALAGGDFKKISAESSLSGVKKARSEFPQMAEVAGRVLDSLDPKRWVGRISPRPVLMINGDHDDVVPVEAGNILHDAANEPKEVFYYKGGHVPLGNEMAHVIIKITDWLNGHLKTKT